MRRVYAWVGLRVTDFGIWFLNKVPEDLFDSEDAAYLKEFKSMSVDFRRKLRGLKVVK